MLYPRVLAVIAGVSLEDGLTYAVLSHESQIIFEIIVGLISIYVMYGRHKKVPHNPAKAGLKLFHNG